MKTNKIILGVCTGLFAFSAYAADYPEKSMPMTTIINKLENQGYPVVDEVKYDNNAYRVKAINTQGKEVKVDVDPVSGEITKASSKPTKLNILDAATKIEKAGYHNIYSIEPSGDKYEAKALDKNGKKVLLNIDGNSSKIIGK